MFSSLRGLKETLQPFKASNCSFSVGSTQSAEEEISHAPRKPPKTSVTRQLQRLGSSFSDTDDFLTLSESHIGKTLTPCVIGNQFKTDHQGKEVEKENERTLGFERPKSSAILNHCTGPCDPLLLSSPGEYPPVAIPASINCRLLEHQKEGVRFLYRLYCNNHGGVLGDDMGLGKTIQTIAFLAAVYGKETLETSTKIQSTNKGPVLIICPTSVIHNWESEFSTWATFSVAVYHGLNSGSIIDKLKAQGVEIVITSFDTFRINSRILSEIKWEIITVDEAHRLKNEKSKLYAACLNITTRRRIGLTGTVMQNKIMELFNLFDWVAPGSLGTREHFREYYDEPLRHGQRATAPERMVRIAEERKKHLAEVLRQYMLRRTKEETIGHLMMGKEDNVVFCAMSEEQKRVYKRILQMPDFQCLINKDVACCCGSPLKQVECCKRIVPDGFIWPYLHRDSPDGCDSCPFCLILPCIVKLQQISNHLELIKPNPKDDQEKQEKDAIFAIEAFGSESQIASNENFISLSNAKQCGKMRVLENLLSSWTSLGDKILIFSYSVRMLNILEKLIIRKGYGFSRLDGSTPSIIRQSLVDDFNRSSSKQVFLISTRAGGLGLNLVTANRVVIFDPNWNPAQDLQAQDRSFRFGQKRHVVVFRLLAAGSFEELVYSRQIYKQQLSNIAVSGKTEKRYFDGVQDCKELQGELFGIANLFRDVSEKLFTSDIIEQKHGEITSVKSHSLKKLGVVYAHRNEDVVNYGGCNNVIEEEADFGERKKLQYSLLAEFAGMEVTEFSKWVLSVSSSEMESLLSKFKNKRGKLRKL